MAQKTLLQLRTLVRQKADIENDGNHTTDNEIDVYIQESVEMLHSMLVDGTDGSLFATNAGTLPVLGDNSYQLPGDFSQLVSVDILNGSYYIQSYQADPQEYAQLTLNNNTKNYRHYLRWNTAQGRGELFIFPAPTNASDIAVVYIQEPPVLSTGTDILRWPTFWYQWVVLDSAIKCNIKEESDPSSLMNERALVEKRVRDHIRSMSVARIKTIRHGDKRRGLKWLPSINGNS